MRYPAVTISAALLGVLSLTPFAHAEAAVIERLVVQPSSVTLNGPEDIQRVLVTAVAADGRNLDVTSVVTYQVTDGKLVSVSRAGEIEPKSDGGTEVTVEYQGKSATFRVTIQNSKQQQAPSFLNDVEPILTRVGCNQGACHGKGAGQNGFKLSLRGYAPEFDYEWIARDSTGRRIDTAVPENSLLLRKPLGVASHEGGKVLNVGSREHRVLLAWIEARTPAPRKDDVEVRRLEVLPGNRILKVGQEQQLLARAEFSDGTWRDVTWLTKFESNDAGMIEVTPAGRVRVQRQGETAIRATFLGQVAVVIMTAPHEKPVAQELLAQRNNFVDEHVFNKLAALRIEPSSLCSDEEFLRRAFLDTIGTLPTPPEVRAFLADKRADKRAVAIDALLQRPEFVDYWALQLGDLFQNRRERDHDVRGTKGVRAFHEWLRKQLAANRPWDELVREVLTASGTSSDNPAIGYYIVTVGEHRQAEKSEVVASVAQAFLGTRIGCAQCHNHPLEKYTQDDYYHFAGFFSRMKFDRKEPGKGVTTLGLGTGNPQTDKNPIGVTQPRTGRFLKPQPLDRTQTNIDPVQDPRTFLAAWMTDAKNEYFSGAMVNRIWRHYMGVGLVEPVDDLRASNPPTNPELWQALNREFVAKKFDLKHLMRTILNSRTYQLSSETRPGNANDTRFYSHYYARRLPAEVLLDALAHSTQVADSFPGYPTGVRAIQLPEPGLRSYFLSLFGRSERVTACACERSGEVTMPQLLHLQNGQSVVQKVRAAEGRLSQLLKDKTDDGKIVEELFLATLSKLPPPTAMDAIKKSLAEDNREEVLRDLFWALLNSKEFAFNH
ncbi:MAG: DUF1549 and DUF1553 domain-containing protein [Gemmataceae bacterium]|nr:DUF1549 and DUF1553 domain-containing protein [Gemmataceae bacterium]